MGRLGGRTSGLVAVALLALGGTVGTGTVASATMIDSVTPAVVAWECPRQDGVPQGSGLQDGTGPHHGSGLRDGSSPHHGQDIGLRDGSGRYHSSGTAQSSNLGTNQATGTSETGEVAVQRGECPRICPNVGTGLHRGHRHASVY
ncbi:hypothetical protein U6G28_07395 [Actinomycetaceae bacterium MB13-C1-2]|nr:hypothetical protein U6G28_07395 [Actinomycetaceae bacterium MB13-C1-2]